MNTVKIDNAMIDALANNEAALKLLDFLNTLKLILDSRKSAGGCGRCGSDGDVLRHVYTSAKQVIANLLPEQRVELKKILGADNIVVEFRVGTALQKVEF